MKDYHIYTHYISDDAEPKTSPKYEPKSRKTKAKSKIKQQRTTMFSLTSKVAGGSLVIASKINSYVGALTENTVTASRRKVGLSYTGMVGLALKHPIIGTVAIGAYTADKYANYGIRRYKENLSADFMRKLSGGTTKTRG